MIQLVFFTSFWGCFTLHWRRSLVIKSKGILNFDWVRVTLLSDGGLHYDQESFGGDLCTWMEEMTWLPTWQHFYEGEFSGGQASWATSKPRTRNLASRKFQLKYIVYCLFIFSGTPSLASNNHVLVKILNRLMDLSTVV